uniref:Solute carrier family 47 member 4 n=1 Tax=Xiphophorus maculatus TaxID=8083 RepID=A0A3B5Q107_XIPMA
MNLQLLDYHTPKISLLTPPWKFNRGNIYRSLQLFLHPMESCGLTGWSLDCLQEWSLFIKLAIPSMFMICLSWIFEVGGFLAGVISEVELGAQSIAYQLCIVAYMQAKLSCKVPIICACKTHSTAYVLIHDVRDIIQRVADVMLIFSFMHVSEATAGVAAGVLRGAGKQLVGAIFNIVSSYFIGFPIGIQVGFTPTRGTNEEEGVVQSPGRREFATSTVGDVLPVKQLVLRHGLTLLIMIVILVVGVISSNMIVTLF